MRPLTRLWTDEDGVSAVELGLLAAFILVPLLMGATELGRRAWTQSQLDSAAYAGVEYALSISQPYAQNPSYPASYTAGAVNSAAQSAAQSATYLTVTATASQACKCPTSSGLTPASGSGTPLVCSATPPCGAGGAPGIYVTVTATTTYTPLFQSCGGLLPASVCGGSSGLSSTAVGRFK